MHFLLLFLSRLSPNTPKMIDNRTELDKYTSIPFLFFMQCKNRRDDSKKFVDLPLNDTIENVVTKFKILLKTILTKTNNTTKDMNSFTDFIFFICEKNASPYITYLIMNYVCKIIENSNEVLKREIDGLIDTFMKINFKKPGDDFEFLFRTDDSFDLAKALNVSNDYLIKLTNDIYSKWDQLHVKYKSDGDVEGTLVYLPFPFTIPGGRFREIYYWDSYWITDGQIVCKMYERVQDCIKNLVDLIERFGFVPNGIRKYYSKRSQPPFFTKILWNYYENVPKNYKDFIFDKKILEAMLNEYKFWMENRTIEVDRKGKKYKLNYYYVDTDYPRPESLNEDINTFEKYLKNIDMQYFKDLINEIEKMFLEDKSSWDCKYISNEIELYGHLKAAAESGWDFSSRFLADKTSLFSINTKNIIPVDLNAYLYENELIMSKILEMTGDKKEAEKYKKAADERKEAINEVLWNDDCWYDYDYKYDVHSKDYFYFSNLTPLFCDIDPVSGDYYDILIKYEKYLFGFEGGVPCSSNFVCSQQWDGPNVWAPHQHMLVLWLLKIGEREMALHVARAFYNSVKGNDTTNPIFFEKYRCDKVGKPGGEGEYIVQTGFGWTNGVTIRFVDIFGDDLEAGRGHAKEFEEIKKKLKKKKEDKREDKVLSESDNENILDSQKPRVAAKG